MASGCALTIALSESRQARAQSQRILEGRVESVHCSNGNVDKRFEVTRLTKVGCQW